MGPVDAAAIRVFLESSHLELAGRADAFARAELARLPAPGDDGAARRQARELLSSLGRAEALAPLRGPDLRACVLVREVLAAASPLADAVFAIQGLTAVPLQRAGTEAQRDRWLDPLIRGEAMGAFAMTEPEAGSDVGALRTSARRDGDEWVLEGEKTLISNAGIADLYLLFASTDPAAGKRGISCFLVPAETPGLKLSQEQVLSAPHPLGALRLTDCRIPADALLGEEGRGFALGMATLDRLRPTVAGAACGMAARALREALRHARAREQFGRPLSDFQLVQDKLARMAIDLAAARLLAYRAAWEADGGAERITAEAAMAKAFATEAAQRIVDEAIQIVGGRAVLADHPLDRLYRSVRALRIYEGTTEIQRLIVARHLLEAAAADDEPERAATGTGAEGGAPAEGTPGEAGAEARA